MKRKSKKAEAKGLNDTFILKIKFKDTFTWRIAGVNRDIEKIITILSTLRNEGKLMEDFEILKMTGTTGTIRTLTFLDIKNERRKEH